MLQRINYQVKIDIDSTAFDHVIVYERKDATFYVHDNFITRDKKKHLKDGVCFADIEGRHKQYKVIECVHLDDIYGNRN